jgi:hypothetical protein
MLNRNGKHQCDECGTQLKGRVRRQGPLFCSLECQRDYHAAMGLPPPAKRPCTRCRGLNPDRQHKHCPGCLAYMKQYMATRYARKAQAHG